MHARLATPGPTHVDLGVEILRRHLCAECQWDSQLHLYAAWRLAQNGMADPGRKWGNAVNWKSSIGDANNSPAIGSIAWWGAEVANGSGHVAYVEQVSGTNVFVRADNFVGATKNGYTDAGWISASSVDFFCIPMTLEVVAPRLIGRSSVMAATSSGWQVVRRFM